MKNFNGYTSTWEIMKKVADKEELKELLAIEKRYQEKQTALNPLGQKLMKQKANPLDKVADRIVKNHEIYDEPGPLEKKAKEGKPLTVEEKAYVKANPYGLTQEAYKNIKDETAPPPQFVDSKKIIKPKALNKKTPKNIGEYFKNKGTPRVTPTVKQSVKPIINTHIPYINVNYEPYRPDPRDKLAEAEFKKILDDARKEKELEATRGLPGLIPGASKILERSERRIEQLKPKTYGGDDDL